MVANSDATVGANFCEDSTATTKLEGPFEDRADTVDSETKEDEKNILVLSTRGAVKGSPDRGHKTGGPEVHIILSASKGLGSHLLVVPEGPAGIPPNYSHNNGEASDAVAV